MNCGIQDADLLKKQMNNKRIIFMAKNTEILPSIALNDFRTYSKMRRDIVYTREQIAVSKTFRGTKTFIPRQRLISLKR